MKCAAEKWNEVFILNELIFETLEDSCKSIHDIPIIIVKNALRYPDQVREFLDNGYWWTNPCVEDFRPGKSFEFSLVTKHLNFKAFPPSEIPSLNLPSPPSIALVPS